MTEQADPPRERTPWPMIIGVAVLGLLALLLLLLVLTRDPDGGTATGSATPTPSTSAGASVAGSASPSASPGSTADPSDPSGVATDLVVATTVDALIVRGQPGTGAERLGTLENGALSFVAGGPTEADGFGWYLVSGLGLPPNTGCAGELDTEPFNCPVWFGWVASASEAGEPWLVVHDLACPEEPHSTENLAIARTSLERLACFGSSPITFRGWWPELPDGLGGACAAQDEPSGWLLCQNINYNSVLIDDTQDFGGIGIRLSVDPESGVTMPERGTWIELTAHLDDPAAQGCDEAAGALPQPDPRAPEQIVLDCRAEMVVDEVQAVDGP